MIPWAECRKCEDGTAADGADGLCEFCRAITAALKEHKRQEIFLEALAVAMFVGGMLLCLAVPQ